MSAPGTPAPGTVEGGYRFLGGNPAAPESWKPLEGDEYLQSLPQGDRDTVKMMAEGRMPPPTSFAIAKPYWQQKIKQANRYDPTFDETTWGSRAGSRKSFFGGGKDAQMLQSGNTAITHLGHLAGQVGDVSGMQFPLIGNLLNEGVNAYKAHSGIPGVQAYNDTLGHLAEETTKFYRGTGGNEADINRTLTNLGDDLSTAQKVKGVGNTASLIYGRFQAMADQYNKVMGTKHPPSYFMSPQARSVMMEVSKRTGTDFGDPGLMHGAAPKPSAPSAQHVTSDADYDKLPSGAVFIGPDGKMRRKP